VIEAGVQERAELPATRTAGGRGHAQNSAGQRLDLRPCQYAFTYRAAGSYSDTHVRPKWEIHARPVRDPIAVWRPGARSRLTAPRKFDRLTADLDILGSSDRPQRVDDLPDAIVQVRHEVAVVLQHGVGVVLRSISRTRPGLVPAYSSDARRQR
jgi:hypothetical protein